MILTIVFACLLTVSVVSAAENVTDDIKNNNFLNVNEDVNLSCSIDNSNDILLKNNEIESDFKYLSDNEDSNNVLGYSNNESDSLSRVWVDSDRKNWVHVSNQVTYDYNDYFTFSINYPFDGEAGIIKAGSDGTSYEYFTKITDGYSEKSTNIDLSRLSAGNYVFFVDRYDFTNYHPEWGDGYRYSLVSVSFNVLEAPKSNVPIKSSTSDNSQSKSTKSTKSSVSLSVTKKTFKTTDTKKKCDVTLKCKNKAIKNAKITLKVNGKTYKTTTNSKGIGTFKLTKLTKSGNYKATFSFAGKGNYAKVSKKVVLTVSKAIPKLTAKDKTFKSNDNIRKYTVTLKTNKNKVMSKSKITLKINGVTYTAKTNSKGVATFKLTKLTKGKTYAATVKFVGNKNYKSISKNVKITINTPVKKTSNSATPDTITVKLPEFDRVYTGTAGGYTVQAEKWKGGTVGGFGVWLYKNGQLVDKDSYLSRAYFYMNGEWKWSDWGNGQGANYHKYPVSNGVEIKEIEVKF